MKPTTIFKTILPVLFILLAFSSSAQNWDADIVRAANSEHNSSTIWRITNNSVRPISAGLPVAMLATGIFTKNKDLKAQSLEMLGGLAITVVTTEGLKVLINGKRPYQLYSAIYPDEYKDGKSFPSGHAALAFYTAASLTINCPEWYVALPSFGYAGAVVYARLYYGQHTPSDLIGSFIVGVGSAYAARQARNWITKSKTPTRSLLNIIP